MKRGLSWFYLNCVVTICFHMIIIFVEIEIPWISEQINVKDYYGTRFEKSPLIAIQKKYHRLPKKSSYFQQMKKYWNNSRHYDFLQPRPHRKDIQPYVSGGRNSFNYEQNKRPHYGQSMIIFRRKHHFGDQNKMLN